MSTDFCLMMLPFLHWSFVYRFHFQRDMAAGIGKILARYIADQNLWISIGVDRTKVWQSLLDYFFAHWQSAQLTKWYSPPLAMNRGGGSSDSGAMYGPWIKERPVLISLLQSILIQICNQLWKICCTICQPIERIKFSLRCTVHPCLVCRILKHGLIQP